MVPTWGHGGRAPPRRSSSHRVKVSPPGRRSPFASGEMPVALSLRNLPREEAPLAFPGYTALRKLLPAHGAHPSLPTLRASAKATARGLRVGCTFPSTGFPTTRLKGQKLRLEFKRNVSPSRRGARLTYRFMRACTSTGDRLLRKSLCLSLTQRSRAG